MIFILLNKIISINNKYINYLIFKNLISFLISFIINILINYKYIDIFIIKNIIQKSKNINLKLDKNIPTMGGIFILISIIISIFLCIEKINITTMIIIFTLISYSILGFIDDYIKVSNKYKQNGLSIKYKYIIQSILTFLIIYLIYKYTYNENINKYIFIPFIKKNILISNRIFFFIISYFTIIGSVNSVNITDGLDGLSINLIIHVLSFFILSNNMLKINNISFIEVENIINICFIIIGSGLSFLWFNSYPSNIFMGDTGSLSLGSFIGIVSILLNKELLLIIVGGIFVIETFSVIIQIIYVKFFNKKFFLMAPLHHHYQIKEVNESKIVTRLIIISIILNLIGILSLV